MPRVKRSDASARKSIRLAYASFACCIIRPSSVYTAYSYERLRLRPQAHPKGYAEFTNRGVINWGIPLEEFSNTYNGQPLCYVGDYGAGGRLEPAGPCFVWLVGDVTPIWLVSGGQA
jgi:hypothetical protein